MINVGIIGAGRIADLHAPGYLEHPNARIAAVADSDGAHAARRADEWGADAHYSDHRQLLDDDSIDGVEVLTPHSSHSQIIIDALSAGKHVSVQKPMAVSLEQCDAIVDAASKSSRIFRVFENFAYYEPLVRAKQLLDDGAIGDAVSLRMKTLMGGAQYGWYVSEQTKAWRFDDRVSGGGRIVLDYGWHIFAVSRILLGPPAQTFAHIGRTDLGDRVIDSPLAMQWSMSEGNATASWEANSSPEMIVHSDYYAEGEWFEITGTRGVIWVNQCTGKMLTNQPPLVMYVDGEFSEWSTAHIDADWGSSFKRGVTEFVDAIANGGVNPDGLAPGVDAATAREIYQHARSSQLSAAAHRPVAPSEVVS